MEILAKKRGWTQTELAQQAGLSRQALNRAMNTDMVSPEVAQSVSAALGTTPAELRAMRVEIAGAGSLGGRTVGEPTMPYTTEPASAGAGGLSTDDEGDLRELIGYWRAKQESAIENSATSSRLAREATDMLDRAIQTFREIHEHTTPYPFPLRAREVTPAARADVVADALAQKLKRERAAAGRQNPAGKSKRRAGGG